MNKKCLEVVKLYSFQMIILIISIPIMSVIQMNEFGIYKGSEYTVTSKRHYHDSIYPYFMFYVLAVVGIPLLLVFIPPPLSPYLHFVCWLCVNYKTIVIFSCFVGIAVSLALSPYYAFTLLLHGEFAHLNQIMTGFKLKMKEDFINKSFSFKETFDEYEKMLLEFKHVQVQYMYKYSQRTSSNPLPFVSILLCLFYLLFLSFYLSSFLSMWTYI